MLEIAVALVHLVVTWFLVGLIWVIQRVHYPLMRFVDEANFPEFEKSHTDRIGLIVAPTMLIEAISFVALCLIQSDPIARLYQTLGLLLLVIIWGSTFWVQVPIHSALAKGKDTSLIDRLVSTNWIRTFAWTMRGGIVILHVYVALF